VLRRLGVFAGAFDIAAAVAVAGTGADTERLVRDLAREALVHVERGSGALRVRLLRTVRDLALSELSAVELADARRRHREWYAARWRGTELHDELVQALRRDHDDYLAALRSALQDGSSGVGDLAVTLTYSAIWKHMAVIDLIAIAGGFVLRAIAGAVAVNVPMSTWFLLCTSFASLFIVTGKRYAELREGGEAAAQARSTLEAYSLGYLRVVLSVSLGAAIITYCDWAFEITREIGPSIPFYELSIIPMLAALLRYTLVLEQGHGAAPEEIFVADRMLQALGLLWVIVFGLGVYVR